MNNGRARPSDQAGRAAHGVASSTASPPSGDHPSRLRELAERCEQAARPDRELDCLIHCALKGWEVVYEGVNVFADMGPTMRRMLVGWLDPGKEQRNFSMTSDSLAPSYTASLDAAMTLASGFGGEVTFFKDGTAKAYLWQPYPLAIEAKAATPALALCAAALKARAASVDTLPKGQDAKQGLAGTEGSAVPHEDAADAPIVAQHRR